MLDLTEPAAASPRLWTWDRRFWRQVGGGQRGRRKGSARRTVSDRCGVRSADRLCHVEGTTRVTLGGRPDTCWSVAGGTRQQTGWEKGAGCFMWRMPVRSGSARHSMVLDSDGQGGQDGEPEQVGCGPTGDRAARATLRAPSGSVPARRPIALDSGGRSSKVEQGRRAGGSTGGSERSGSFVSC